VGIHPVARALRLDYYSLKRRVDGAASRRQSPAAAFVEVALSPSASSCSPVESVIEMERPDGARMRIRVASEASLVGLTEAFWRGQS
jgi:hypothetical protein